MGANLFDLEIPVRSVSDVREEARQCSPKSLAKESCGTHLALPVEYKRTSLLGFGEKESDLLA